MPRRVFLDHLVPPSAATDRKLDEALRRTFERRLGAALRGWRRERGHGRAIDVLEALPRESLEQGAARRLVLALEDSLSVASVARRTKAGASLSDLVARVADWGELARLAPRGRIPRDFRERVLAAAHDKLDALAFEVALVALPFLPPEARRGALRIEFRPEIDLGRPRDELDIPGGGIRLVRRARSPRRDTLRLGGNAFQVGGLTLPYPAPQREGSRYPLAPDVGAVLKWQRGRVVVGRRDPRFESRVDRALDMLEAAWPEACRMVVRVVDRVVPVDERSIVSFSSPRLPGVGFIHVGSRPTVRLAEDLLHEATHLRLHRIEAIVPLMSGDRGDDEPRFYSPWRREWRPLRGIVHACCTFTVGAQFFARMLEASAEGGSLRLPRSRRLWLARRLLEERLALRGSLRSIAAARRRGWLTPEGIRLERAVRREFRGSSRSSRAALVLLTGTAAGKRELRRLSDFEATLRTRPQRHGAGAAAPGAVSF